MQSFKKRRYVDLTQKNVALKSGKLDLKRMNI